MAQCECSESMALEKIIGGREKVGKERATKIRPFFLCVFFFILFTEFHMLECVLRAS